MNDNEFLKSQSLYTYQYMYVTIALLCLYDQETKARFFFLLVEYTNPPTVIFRKVGKKIKLNF